MLNFGDMPNICSANLLTVSHSLHHHFMQFSLFHCRKTYGSCNCVQPEVWKVQVTCPEPSVWPHSGSYQTLSAVFICYHVVLELSINCVSSMLARRVQKAYSQFSGIKSLDFDRLQCPVQLGALLCISMLNKVNWSVGGEGGLILSTILK